MIGCLRTRVRKQPIIALYFDFENELKFYNLATRPDLDLNCLRLMVFLKGLLERKKDFFEKNQQKTKFPSMKRVQIFTAMR